MLLLCLYVSQTSPEPCATITISAGICVCWQNAFPHHSIETNSSSLCKLCPVGLSGVGDHDRHLCIALLENRSKLPHSLQGHQCLLTGLHWDHHRCLICFKREIRVQQDNNKWFKLPATLDWQTHSPCSDLALFTGNGEQESHCHCTGTKGPHSSVVTDPALFLGKQDNLTRPYEVWWLSTYKRWSYISLIYFFPFKGHTSVFICVATSIVDSSTSLPTIFSKEWRGDFYPYRVSSSRQGSSLNWSAPVTAIIPQHNLARVCSTNDQVWVKAGKTDRHHRGLE